MKKIIFLILFFFILLLGYNCKNNKNENLFIELPETKIHSDLNQWAVVNSESPRLRVEPDRNSKVINYIPIGTLIKVIKKKSDISFFNNEYNYWHYIDYDGEIGWIFGTFIEVFNNLDEAEKRCEEILVNIIIEKEKE